MFWQRPNRATSLLCLNRKVMQSIERQKRFTTKKPTGGPQRKVKKAQEVEDLSKKLEDKLAMAMEVCDSELTST